MLDVVGDYQGYYHSKNPTEVVDLVLEIFGMENLDFRREVKNLIFEPFNGRKDHWNWNILKHRLIPKIFQSILSSFIGGVRVMITNPYLGLL